MFISSEFNSLTLIFYLRKSFSGYRTMLFALEEPENGSQCLKVNAEEPDTVTVIYSHSRETESMVIRLW